MQLPSATGPWLTPARTYTVLIWRLHRRTHSRESGNPVILDGSGCLPQFIPYLMRGRH